ncbi:MAG: DUF2269 family protein [Deltaproteobacteria bacterium]|nr:DUF2269 family protein [Deltaproteobacteria bacterium]
MRGLSFPAKVVITTNSGILVLMVLALRDLAVPAFASYPLLKTLHIFGAISMIGNVLVGPAWILLAMRTKNQETKKFAFQALGMMDVFFTAPGAAMLAVTGLAMAPTFGGVNAQAWLHQPVWLLIGVVLFATTAVLYTQEKAIQAAVTAAPDFRLWFVWWSVLGTLVSLPLILIVWLMVSKQGF